MPYSAIHPTHFVPYQRSQSISGINLLKLEGYFDKTLRKELLQVVKKKEFLQQQHSKIFQYLLEHHFLYSIGMAKVKLLNM